jgi:hypothetical protein
MNAHFLRSMGCGDFCPLEEVTPDRVRRFLEERDRHLAALATLVGRMDGTADVLHVIEHRLETARSVAVGR